MNEAGNNTAVQLNGNTLTLNVATGSAFGFSGVITGSGGLVMSGGGGRAVDRHQHLYRPDHRQWRAA